MFVDFSGRHGLYDDALRWCYTAITRAKETLFICNAPNINAFSNIKVTKNEYIAFGKEEKKSKTRVNALRNNFYALRLVW